MAIENALAAVAVTDLDDARSFYARVLGRGPDVEPMPTLAQWDLPAGGSLQVVVDPDRAGRSMVTLLVRDFDAVLRSLTEDGLRPTDAVTGVISRLTQLTDPAGNVVTVAEIPEQP